MTASPKTIAKEKLAAQALHIMESNRPKPITVLPVVDAENHVIDGELFKAFNARDGLGLSCLLRSGVRVAIITGRKSAIIHRRAEELGITELYEGIKDKRKILADLAAAGGLGQEEIAYMGDDLNDLPALLYAGLACAPADAAPEVIAASSFVAVNNGGRGAVREAAELILKAQGKWNEIVNAYMKQGQGDSQ